MVHYSNGSLMGYFFGSQEQLMEFAAEEREKAKDVYQMLWKEEGFIIQNQSLMMQDGMIF